MADSRERIRAKEGREFLTSPRQVLRRLMLLSEGRQYREAAGVIGRLGPSVLRSVITELPIDLLLEALPHSAYLLESFFSRLNTVNPSPKPNVPTEGIIWQLVRLFANPHESGLRQRCIKLIQSLENWEPNLRQILKDRRKSLDQTIQGLGIHGLISDYNNKLISLHIALKYELIRHIDIYKLAVHKLDELSTVILKNNDPAQSSHQRLLAINYYDIQQRLIDNKTLLTILEKPDLKQLQILIKNLNERVQNDKEVLLNVGQIRRLDTQTNIDDRPAAGLLMNFSRGCNAVLQLMGPENKPSSPNSSDGYHSDSDTPIDEINNEMVRQYRYFYTENRSDTLETLNSLPQLKQVPNLKAKILFSIIVLSFRACNGLRERKIMEVRRLLCCPMESVVDDETVLSLDRSIRKYLHDTTNTYPMGDIERQVSNQVLSTLHEYPCLESCTTLIQFISQCVRLSWKMVNHQNLPYYLDNDFTLGFLCPEKHERYTQSSDKRSDLIKTFLWPSLMQNNRCIVKAIVTT